MANDVWKVLIVDDDEQIHAVTKMVLSAISASATAACNSCRPIPARRATRRSADNPDIAVVFLDVVMETETAGLDLARDIRGAPRQRLRAHHPAHRSARPGAGTQGDRRLRHQRLQGKIRTDVAETVQHHGHGAAFLQGHHDDRDQPPRAGEDHQRLLLAVPDPLDGTVPLRRAPATRLVTGGRHQRGAGQRPARRTPTDGAQRWAAEGRRRVRPVQRHSSTVPSASAGYPSCRRIAGRHPVAREHVQRPSTASSISTRG